MGKSNTNQKGYYIVAILLSLLWLGINYYIYYPALNIQSTEFWSWLLFHSVIISGIFILSGIVSRSRKVSLKSGFRENWHYFVHGKGRLQLALLVFIPVGCVLVLFIGGLSGSPIFNAKRYSKLLAVEQRDFKEDIPESENVDNIALMDTNSATVFGNRKIGSLSDVVSQFEVEDSYTQINVENSPLKVANLQYASFFKYLSNRKNGIPGYITVNPVNSKSEYVKLSKGMKYVTSGYFHENIYRHVQVHNPTKIIEGCYFEINDEGEPFYVCPVLHARVGLFGGMDVKGAVLCSPVTGDMEYYSVKDIPTWVDRVYDGELLEQKFNWYGLLSGGYWNSVIGQKGCIQTTDDYGYKTIEDDVWVYTGVTSVTGDASNVGFVMINQRTSEARYYSISGAEEYSAMSSAQGEVQEKNYKASFPSLINVDGTPTYIMVLTDNGGLVKMYAMVNVEQYNLVVTAETQEEVFAKYRSLLAKEGNQQTGDTEENMEEGLVKNTQFVVESMEYIAIEGDTYVYIRDDDGNVYKQRFADNEELIKISAGDLIAVQYQEQDNGIHKMITATLEKKGSETGRRETTATEENRTEDMEENADNSRVPDNEEQTNTSTEETATEEKEEQEGDSI
ncbi:MAG: hypothetical protein NC124_01185 [Clostridium sp.]|nr:hypothetical protein [Clostridium sp.]